MEILFLMEKCGPWKNQSVPVFTKSHCQGGESRNFLQFFCTCIRTELVREMFIISLILNEFSRGKVIKLCIYSTQQNICDMFLYYALYFSIQVRAKTHILLEFV